MVEQISANTVDKIEKLFAYFLNVRNTHNTNNNLSVVIWQITQITTYQYLNLLYVQCESIKTIHLTSDHNFGKCRPILKFFH